MYPPSAVVVPEHDHHHAMDTIHVDQDAVRPELHQQESQHQGATIAGLTSEVLVITEQPLNDGEKYRSVTPPERPVD